MKRALYIIVILVGSLQIIGYIVQSKTIRGLGIATGTSPLPIVFTEVRGVETFASDFFILYNDSTGNEQRIQITPAFYSRMKGPYNRRNIYGAAISYGPVLDTNLTGAVLDFGLCRKVLLDEMRMPRNGSNYRILIRSRTAGRNESWLLTRNCKP